MEIAAIVLELGGESVLGDEGERFVTDIAGDFDAATIRPGRRQFVGF